MQISSPSELPRVNGIRQRGLEMTRIETFTDAAFAFALTMLVISFDRIPDSLPEFQEALKNIPAFAASFAQISLFWYAHHVWSRRYGLDDAGTALLSLLLVFVTLIYVFPLRVIFSGLFAWITAGWLPFTFGEQIGGAEMGWVFFVYGLGFAAMSYLIAAHYWHAHHRSDVLALDAYERFHTRSEIEAWSIAGTIGLISSIFGISAPARLAAFAGFFYCLLPIVMPIFAGIKKRQGAALIRQEA